MMITGFSVLRVIVLINGVSNRKERRVMNKNRSPVSTFLRTGCSFPMEVSFLYKTHESSAPKRMQTRISQGEDSVMTLIIKRIAKKRQFSEDWLIHDLLGRPFNGD